jgi:long-chain acyl-CoA synthetase
MNLATALTDTAERHGDRTAIKLDDYEISYAQLNEACARVAALLKDRRLGPGDRVGIMLPNVPQFAATYYGVLRAGGVVVPMNPLLKKREAGFYLENPAAKLVFAWHDFEEAAKQGADDAGTELILVEPGKFEQLLSEYEPDFNVVDRGDDETAVILYTSGTTGKPKGAELTHSNLLKNTEAGVQLAGASEDDILLGALPLFHSFGQTCGLNAAMSAGATLSMIRSRLSSATASRSSRASRRCSPPCSTTTPRTTWTSRPCACACRAARPCPSR